MNFKGETIEKIELNKVYLMDALEGIKKIEDKSIDLIVTDPPYFQGLTCNGKKGEFNDLIICKPFFSEFAKQCKRVLKDTGKFYMFCDWRGYAFYYSVLCQELPIRNLIVWDKTSGMGNMYNYQHEFILYATMTPCNQGGKKHLANSGLYQSSDTKQIWREVTSSTKAFGCYSENCIRWQ